MKIGKLTLDGYFNYGNVLQNYALQEVLKRYGDVDSLWHSQDNFLPRIWHRWTWKEYVKFVLNWRCFRTKIFSDFHGMEMVRQGRIKEWCDRYIGIKRTNDMLKIAGDYDYFVIGSDQVWKPYFSNELLEHFFLTFASHNKRIAYATSISCPSIPKEKRKLYIKWLSEMAHISVREHQGAEIIKELSGRDVPVLVDPTMLLTSNEWRKVSRRPAWYHGGDFILTYFLGKRPEIVYRLQKETGLKIINLLDEDVYEHYVTGPDEFLWAIEHTKLMYTDSFHGTVFSILFRTPFVVCNRIGSAMEEKMGSRIDTLLGYFGLETRRGTKENGYAIENPLTEPDWSQVDEVLSRERKRANDYLRQALGVDA